MGVLWDIMRKIEQKNSYDTIIRELQILANEADKKWFQTQPGTEKHAYYDGKGDGLNDAIEAIKRMMEQEATRK